MVSKDTKKKQIRILRKFDKMILSGKGKMEAYKKLAKEFGMSVGGIRHAILCAKDYMRQPAPPIPQEILDQYK